MALYVGIDVSKEKFDACGIGDEGKKLFSLSNLKDADLREANLQRAKLQGAHLEGADLGSISLVYIIPGK